MLSCRRWWALRPLRGENSAVAVGFGLEFCLQPPAHPLPAFGFHRQFHFAQGAKPLLFRVHPNGLSFEVSLLGEEPLHPHYAHIMVQVSNCAQTNLLSFVLNS